MLWQINVVSVEKIHINRIAAVGGWSKKNPRIFVHTADWSETENRKEPIPGAET